ncbi:MAG: amidohydrolase family protein [Planctomycetes bacterium]|nr:amidohydrolase family protein [Planctomycetota bacterium]
MSYFNKLHAAGAALLLVILGSAVSLAAGADKVALVGGRIIPVVGDEISKGTILIERGKIVDFGEKLEIPFDAKVIDVSGKVVFPGMVDAHTWRGLDIPNESRPVTPQLSAYDAIDPSRLNFEDMLRNGITTVHVIQANNTVIGGVGWVVRPIGLSLSEMTVAQELALKISITPKRGFDRLRQMATLRATFLELHDYLDKLAEERYEAELEKQEKKIEVGPAEARKRGRELIRAEDIDDEHRNLLRLCGTVGDRPRPPLDRIGAFIYCGNAMDVAHAVKIAKDNGFFDRTVFVLGGETYKAIAELKAAARPVILPTDLVYRESDPLTGKISEVFVPSIIAKAGLLYAVGPGPDASLPERMMNYQAARLVRNGISRSDALRAITINPAKILGLDKRLGSIEKGKDANLVIFSGDPLDFNSVVEMVLIDGIPAYERDKDVRLKRLLAPASDEDSE